VDAPDATPLEAPRGEISFENVSFRYAESAAALNAFSLRVPACSTVALVGESGAGKSTVFNLLLRLYEAEAGVIRIDGADISAATISSLRDAIAFVGQDAFLFNGTVRENIVVGRPEADDEEVRLALIAAAADGFVEASRDGLETLVGEGGGALSGGQRQRIALARAFIKNAPIILLDEATSALDAESEARVQAAVDALSENRTTFIIAHRLSTVRKADMIVVMEKGRVVETGDHETLLAAKGAYARLVDLQLSGGETSAD
ncbi:MAG: ATP-binding cassette domain-containing protein, partial [Pseudomonadota bacterium]